MWEIQNSARTARVLKKKFFNIRGNDRLPAGKPPYQNARDRLQYGHGHCLGGYSAQNGYSGCRCHSAGCENGDKGHENQHIGVIGTVNTIKSRAYEQASPG